MLSDPHCSSSIKSDGLMHNSKRLKSSKCPVPNRLLLTCKSLNEKLSDKKSIDITSRLGQFAWRQIIPSAIFLPVIFRHVTREEYLCVQMVKLHLLCRFTSESLSYCMSKCPFPQYPLTLYEAELLHYINTFHSKGTLSLNNQLCYSKLDSTAITPFSSFIKFYQFLVSTAQFTNSNQLWFSSRLSSSSSSSSSSLSNKPIRDKEKAIMSSVYDSAKNVLSKKTETNNSFCREIVFHGKEILSYCTTSSSNVNEKDHQTIACLSIKDIVSVYFPWSNIEDFIQICRKKQIIRFKPDKSTDCDSSLRLVNIQELEHHWNYILKELLPTTQAPLNYPPKSDQMIEKEPLPAEIPVTKNIEEEILTSNVNIDESIKSVEPSPCLTPHPPPPAEEEEEEQQQPVTDNSVSNEMENAQHLLDDIPCEINESSETMEPQVILELSTKEAEEPEVKEKEKEAEAEDVSTIAEINISLENTSLKQTQRRRRRSKISTYSSKKRKRENLKTIDNEQFWLKKYSIEPFSILLDRYQLPVDD
ncbi:unnamed protein product [Adineta ricciae]|uniref:Uncharacterized protein n=1 Tax=Adineta ricciae TaxID=249248 RepID=A0A814E5P0_ADIRI|nr:unnamed protein product [Adineta ricciae]